MALTQANVFDFLGTLEEINSTAPASSCAGICAAHAQSQCEQSLGGKNVTVIMVADPGEFSSTPENYQYVHNLKDVEEYDGNYTMCLTKHKVGVVWAGGNTCRGGW